MSEMNNTLSSDLNDILFFVAAHVERSLVCGVQRLPGMDQHGRVRILLRNGGYIDLLGGFSYEEVMRVWLGENRSHPLLREERLARLSDAIDAYIQWSRGALKKEKDALQAFMTVLDQHELKDLSARLRSVCPLWSQP